MCWQASHVIFRCGHTGSWSHAHSDNFFACAEVRRGLPCKGFSVGTDQVPFYSSSTDVCGDCLRALRLPVPSMPRLDVGVLLFSEDVKTIQDMLWRPQHPLVAGRQEQGQVQRLAKPPDGQVPRQTLHSEFRRFVHDGNGVCSACGVQNPRTAIETGVLLKCTKCEYYLCIYCRLLRKYDALHEPSAESDGNRNWDPRRVGEMAS